MFVNTGTESLAANETMIREQPFYIHTRWMHEFGQKLILNILEK